MKTLDVGDRVRATGRFTNSAGSLADPTSVACTVRHPNGSASSPSVTRGSLGVYLADFSLDGPGHWFYRFTGTGLVVAAGEGQFYVRERKA